MSPILLVWYVTTFVDTLLAIAGAAALTGGSAAVSLFSVFAAVTGGGNTVLILQLVAAVISCVFLAGVWPSVGRRRF